MAADALAGARLIAVVAIDTGHTLTGASAGTTEWRVTTAPGVVSLIAHRTGTGHTLAKARLITIGINSATHTGRSIRPIDAEWGVSCTAGVGGHITGHARCVDTLLTITICIATTFDTYAAIGRAERCIHTTTGVIGRVTGSTDFVDALLTITIAVTATTDTTTAIG